MIVASFLFNEHLLRCLELCQACYVNHFIQFSQNELGKSQPNAQKHQGCWRSSDKAKVSQAPGLGLSSNPGLTRKRNAWHLGILLLRATGYGSAASTFCNVTMRNGKRAKALGSFREDFTY